MKAAGAESPPCTVTSEFHVKLLRVTPSNGPVRLRARVVESKSDRATVEAELEADGKTTATWEGNDEPWTLAKKDGVWKVVLAAGDAQAPLNRQVVIAGGTAAAAAIEAERFLSEN